MSVPIIIKTGIFTAIIILVMVFGLFLTGTLSFLSTALLVIIIFFLILDVFEREATRLGKKV